ncbi:hypothetical protein U9M48_036793 [Paspalum notatum var. saurae]|uniref:BHLH domain-containing protein n=1 Tax=Paspalum notatum var. saurae TaxID=547442 RepID=A0AAQ3UE95_PASNO
MDGGGWLPLDLSLATAGPSASAPAGERRRQQPARAQRRRSRSRSVSALFAELRAMLPNVPDDRPVSQEEIVDAAAERVRTLADTVGVLEAYRAVRAPPRPAPPEVSAPVATVCVCARLPAPAPGAVTRVLQAFHRRGVEVLVATVARHGHAGAAAAVVTVTAAAAPPEVMELVRADIARIY